LAAEAATAAAILHSINELKMRLNSHWSIDDKTDDTNLKKNIAAGTDELSLCVASDTMLLLLPSSTTMPIAVHPKLLVTASFHRSSLFESQATGFRYLRLNALRGSQIYVTST
jgi:hypothetical protein